MAEGPADEGDGDKVGEGIVRLEGEGKIVDRGGYTGDGHGSSAGVKDAWERIY